MSSALRSRARTLIIAALACALPPGGQATPYEQASSAPTIAKAAGRADPQPLDIGPLALRDAASASVRSTNEAEAGPPSDPTGTVPPSAAFATLLPRCNTLALLAAAVALQVVCAKTSGGCGTVDSPAASGTSAVRPVPRRMPPSDCQPRTIKFW